MAQGVQPAGVAKRGGSATVDDVLAAARSVITGAHLCFLATSGADSGPHVRLMQQFETDENFTTWLGTGRATRKVEDIVRRREVTVAFQGADGASYACLSGSARIVDDAATKRRYWREEWKEFFPGAPDGGDYVVIAVTADRLEVVDFPAHIEPPPYGVAAAVAERGSTGWVLGTPA